MSEVILKQRSEQQNRAMHLAFDHLAKALNLAGLDMRIVLKPEINIPWTISSVKEHLFRPIMKAMTSKDSTTELLKSAGEIDTIWETLMRHLMEKHHIEYIAFPSYETSKDEAPLVTDTQIKEENPWNKQR